MLTEVNMNEILGGGSTKPRQILISEKAWMNRLVHINIWPGNYDLVSDQTSFFIFVGRAWPISFINSPGHFFLCLFSVFSCYMLMLSQNRALKKERQFSFPVIICFARRKSGPSWKHQSWVAAWKEWIETGREGWMEHRKGDPRKRLAPSDPLNGFPLSGYGESGWEGSGVLPTPFGADAVTLSPHASTHLSQLCEEANKQTTSDVTQKGGGAQ